MSFIKKHPMWSLVAASLFFSVALSFIYLLILGRDNPIVAFGKSIV